MLHIILYEPEIPPNTGNIIRLCANTGSQLHLIKPLGFTMEDKQLRRAGLDYHEWASVRSFDSLENCLTAIKPQQCYYCSTKGKQQYTDTRYQMNDALIFGPETRGLPNKILKHADAQHIIRIPMHKDSRSLNLANAAAVIVYEAYRQLAFPNLA